MSTDQVAAFVELARQGSLRRASEVLHITEQGVRNRLLALEERLKVELYRKSRGMRQTTPLTQRGQEFLPHAIAFLERACELAELFEAADAAAGRARGGQPVPDPLRVDRRGATVPRAHFRRFASG